ncbi:hypothetical protein [Pedobacter sp. NJ-S-72]
MVTKKWILLNNEIMVKKDDEFSLHKDKEAVRSYFLDYVNKNTVFFYTLKEKIDYLIEQEYYVDFFINGTLLNKWKRFMTLFMRRNSDFNHL